MADETSSGSWFMVLSVCMLKVEISVDFWIQEIFSWFFEHCWGWDNSRMHPLVNCLVGDVVCVSGMCDSFVCLSVA